jgi:hypothetical protein
VRLLTIAMSNGIAASSITMLTNRLSTMSVLRRTSDRNLAHPARRRRCRVRQINRTERGDRCGLAVFENREVLRGQALNRTTVLVEDRDVEVDEIDAGAELAEGPVRRARRHRPQARRRLFGATRSLNAESYFAFHYARFAERWLQC